MTSKDQGKPNFWKFPIFSDTFFWKFKPNKNGKKFLRQSDGPTCKLDLFYALSSLTRINTLQKNYDFLIVPELFNTIPNEKVHTRPKKELKFLVDLLNLHGRKFFCGIEDNFKHFDKNK